MVQSPRALLHIQETAIPLWLMVIVAVRDRNDRRHARIGLPCHVLAFMIGVKAELRVGLVERMIIAAGQERTDGQHDPLATPGEPPGHDDQRMAVPHKNLVLDMRPVGQFEAPTGPRLTFKCGDARGAVGIDHIGDIHL